MTVRSRSIPAASSLSQVGDWATWSDCWEAPASRVELSPLELFRAMMRHLPWWVDPAMDLRDRVGGWVGIRAAGRFAEGPSPEAARPGDKIGIFTVRAVGEQEIVVGDDDRHLDFRMAVCRYDEDGPKMAVAMVLHTHNLLGRLYMLPVGPIHRHIVRRNLIDAIAAGAI